MIIDALFAIFLIVFLIRGYKKGLVIALFAIFSIIVGILCALKFSSVIAGLLFTSSSKGAVWLPFLTYIIVFAIVVWLVRLGAKAIDKMMDMVMLGWLNRLSGALIYGLLATLVFSTFLWLLDKVGAFSTETQAASKTYTFLVGLAPGMFERIGALVPFIKQSIDDLSGFFDRLKSLSAHVGSDR